MTPEEYRKKYGDAKIMVIPAKAIEGLQEEGFTCTEDACFEQNGESVPLGRIIHENLMPMPRCEAECDPSFKQVIPYVLVEHKPTERFFMTTRIGGEERLRGQASIGLGGHLDDGEDVVDALFRELEEEIGLEKEQMPEIHLCGYIYSELNEVDSVHIGMVYHAFTDREDVVCREKDKLTGGWFTVSEMREVRRNSHMESWSAMCFDALLDVLMDVLLNVPVGALMDVPTDMPDDALLDVLLSKEVEE